MMKTCFVFAIALSLVACSGAAERANEQFDLLKNKADHLDSIIRSEAVKVQQLDTLIYREFKKVEYLDSLIEVEKKKWIPHGAGKGV